LTFLFAIKRPHQSSHTFGEIKLRRDDVRHNVNDLNATRTTPSQLKSLC